MQQLFCMAQQTHSVSHISQRKMDNTDGVGQIDLHSTIYGPPVVEDPYGSDKRIKPNIIPMPSVYGPPPIFKKVSIIDRIKNLFKKNYNNW